MANNCTFLIKQHLYSWLFLSPYSLLLCAAHFKLAVWWAFILQLVRAWTNMQWQREWKDHDTGEASLRLRGEKLVPIYVHVGIFSSQGWNVTQGVHLVLYMIEPVHLIRNNYLVGLRVFFFFFFLKGSENMLTQDENQRTNTPILKYL
jgi:hypothetical protein